MMGPRAAAKPDNAVKVPEPVNLMLPKSISIHPFTGMRDFGPGGGLQGIDVRIEAKDAFGDANKAFGKFRFELYEFRAQNPDPRGKLIYVWEEDLLDPEKNLQHWNIHRTYEFKLLWERPIEVGRQFVLRAIFSSPFTRQLEDQRVFTAGQ